VIDRTAGQSSLSETRTRRRRIEAGHRPCARAQSIMMQHDLPFPAADPSGSASSSVEAAWALLSPAAQLVLRVACTFVTPRIPTLLLVSSLERMGWSTAAVEGAIDEARDGRLASGDGAGVEVHQLVARFVRERVPLEAPVRGALFQGLIATAEAFRRAPGDLNERAQLVAHSLELDDWADLVTAWHQWHVLGDVSMALGRFEAALRWYERAVAAAEQGDAHGRVDAESLGTSLVQVGYCHAKLGQIAEAMRWYERAAAALAGT
jgi:tetratricopeptide (TPR) repeat protein